MSSRTGYGRPTPYHEDSEYWWQHGKGRVTKEGLAHIVTLWVAIDSSHRENGCMRVLRGSHVSGAAGWVDGGATPQPVLRLVPPTPAGLAFASTPLQQLAQHQARQEELQQRRQSERGMLGGLMHQQRLEQHATPEPEPEPEPAAAPSDAAPAQQQLQDWSVAQIVSWIAETMKLPAVAEAAAQEEVDGATAIEMGKEEWKELGSSGVKAAKLVGALKKLAAAAAQ